MNKRKAFLKMNLPLQWLAVILLLLAVNIKAMAGIDPPVIAVLDGSLGHLKEDTAVMVEDAKFYDSFYDNLLIKPYPVTSIVSLELNEGLNATIPGNFEITVNATITYTLANGSTDVDMVQFNLTYVGNNTYTHRQTYVYKNAYRVNVTVTDISGDVEAVQFVKLVNQLQSFPLYEFDCFDNVVTSINDSAWAADTDKDELPVYWAPVTGADEYDLEWTYIDSGAFAGGKYGDTSSLNAYLLFDNNASRVTITGTLYNIPLLYDNKGHLFFRVRAVRWGDGFGQGGGRNEAVWSTLNMPGGLGRFNYNGHERTLNWQATTTFAEDGKRKTVVQYYDGSLRARQTVTKDNSTNKTIVAESFYDYQGRPVIQVLPAPTLNTIIGYSQNFNQGINGYSYDKSYYDSLAGPGDYCDNGADSMDEASGAAQYYSPANPLADSGFHKYIPDAENYPFTEVQYTQDNTGRISRQSGVGKPFRIGSGHETKYFYGTPGQRELDALFGTEVGDRSHYFKTMVRDANGQYSVSYTDMRGRTIATALAGVPPGDIKLDTLASYTSAIRTEALSDPASVVIKDLVMESKKGLLVAKGGDHTFTYQLTPQLLQQEGCDSVQVCYECLYDLQITITDDCNNQKLGGQPFDTLVHNFSIGAIDTSCTDSSGGFSFSFIKYLEEGSYEVTKKLSVSRYALDYYRDSIFMQANTCNTIDSFLYEQRQLTAGVVECKPACASCTDSLGTFENFRLRFMEASGIAEEDTAGFYNMALQAYRDAQEDCAVLCDSLVSEYNDIRKAMLMDMTPSSGQYANIDNDNDLLSVFYTSVDDNSIDTAKYRLITNYKDADGNPDLVYDEGAGKPVPPQQLSPELFVQKFKLSWAESLLQFHPEYCKLQWYDTLRLSHEWDRRFAGVDTYEEAKEKGYLNPINESTFTNRLDGESPDVDPLNTLQSGIFHSKLKDSIELYRTAGELGTISMWGVACATVMCEGTDAGCYTTYTDTANVFNTDSMCVGELDMAWRIYRQMYLDIKRNIINQWLKTECSSSITATAIVAAGHSPHFSDATELLNASGVDYPASGMEATAFQQQHQQQVNEYYNATCNAYVSLWIQQLSACTLYHPDSLNTVIIPRLVQVCKEGADAGHPYGASSVKPSSTYEFRSFEAVIEHYNQTHSITDSISCNAIKITAPRPYEQQPVYSNKPVYTKPDDCECAAIATHYEKYQLVQGDYDSFSDFLLQRFNTTISDSVLDILLSYCAIGGATPASCPYLETPLFLPPVFQCYTGSVCVDCAQFKQLEDEFSARFPDAEPALADTAITDSAQLSRNLLYEQFMNSRLGFAKTIDEYLAFAAQCVATPSSPACDSLIQLINNFKVSRQAYGIQVAFGTPEGQVFTDFEDIVQNGAIQLPDTIQQKPGNWYNNIQVTQKGGLNFCWSNGYAIEFRMRFMQNKSSTFYINGVNASLLFQRRTAAFTGNGNVYAPGIYLVSITDNHGNQYGAGYGFNGFGFALASADTNALNNWVNVKLQVAKSHYSVYFNDLLIQTIARDTALSINNSSVFVLGLHGRFGNVDWIKLYDANDQVRYFEDFLDIQNPVMVDHDFLCPNVLADCETAFTTYFNQQKGTGYTYAQIDSVYAATCNINLAPCGNPSNPYLTLCGRSEPVFPPVAVDSIDNCSDSAFFITSKAQELYKVYNDSLTHHFDSSYLSLCMQAYKMETFTVRHAVSEYHHTLYYYNQAGNLVKTVPPAGVQARYDSLWLDSVYTARLAGTIKTPAHTLISQYRYNTLNQLMSRQSPDGGKTDFWYDRLGRLALSRNARQLAASTPPTGGAGGGYYSYTRYDVFGRIAEVGQLRDTNTTSPVTDSFTRNEGALGNWFTNHVHYRGQVTRTQYDVAWSGFAGIDNKLVVQQQNLRNRVSFVTYADSPGLSTAYNNATFYSYDIHGNADTLLNDYGQPNYVANIMNKNGNRFKKFVYQYDLISGKVNMVMYQRGWADQWYHRYRYDAENRLTEVETSSDSLVWEKEGRYEYYRHGPLARMVIGHQQVQGLDYAYTLQGWLKGVNSTGGTIAHDIGGDGKGNSINQFTARDATAFTLNYFAGDYKAIAGGSVNPFPNYSSYLNEYYRPLYNGNISSMSVHNRAFAEIPGGSLLFYNYRYDQLNRLTGQDAFKGFDTTGNNWGAMEDNDDYMTERIAYDANGNIQKYYRNAMSGFSAEMDSLNYYYIPNTNKLRRVTDNIEEDTYHSVVDNLITDIDNQPENNYDYDAIGNLIKDSAENIKSIRWSIYGKILEITRNPTEAVPVSNIQYTYDASGNRISKLYDVGGEKTYTWYVRDAQGNLMSAYAATGNNDSLQDLTVNQTERYIYGSSRLGMYTLPQDVDNSNAGPADMDGYAGSIFTRGLRQYELTNHLGNVLAVISDKKIGIPSDTNSSLIAYYEPEFISAFDYYPFGMTSRMWVNYNYPVYRHGFNGKEMDHEAKGYFNQLDYGMRVSDPRTGGRFYSVDPLAPDYPEMSPYPFAMNRPIDGIDLDGLEWQPYYGNNDSEKKTPIGYNWVGYNHDGTPKSGTVDGGVIRNGNYLNIYSSDAKSLSGKLHIFSLNREEKKFPQGSDRSPLFDYLFNFKDNNEGMFPVVHNVTTEIWNESQTLVRDYELKQTVSSIKDRDLFYEAINIFGLGPGRTSIDAVYPETIFIPVAPKGIGLLGKTESLFAKGRSLFAKSESLLIDQTGGFKQWLRLGNSYSKTGGFKTFGLRWGASPKYLPKIGNPVLRDFNKWLRNRKLLPGINSWWNEPGHIHFRRIHK